MRAVEALYSSLLDGQRKSAFADRNVERDIFVVNRGLRAGLVCRLHDQVRRNDLATFCLVVGKGQLPSQLPILVVVALPGRDRVSLAKLQDDFSPDDSRIRL